MRKRAHVFYYVVEAAVLAFGFYLVAIYATNTFLQMSLIAVILLTYSIMGIFHHVRGHDIHPRIVLEYVLISLFIMSVFLFFKGGTLS